MHPSTDQTAGGEMVLTAADVRLRAAHVRAFRARVWPLQRPAALTARAARPATSAPDLPASASRRDIDALRARLLALAQAAAASRVTVRRVLDMTAAHFGTAAAGLLSRRRAQPLARQRQIAMFVARMTTGRSLALIGHRMQDRHHTTILHGSRAVQRLIDSGDADTLAAVVRIVEQLMGEAAPMASAGGRPWT